MEIATIREVAALQQFRAEVVSAIRRLDEQLAHVHYVADYSRDESGNVAMAEGDEVDAPPREVLVRSTPGPRVEVFHSVEAPCGRVRRKGGATGAFKTMSFGRALERGLRACSACDFPPSVATASEVQR